MEKRPHLVNQPSLHDFFILSHILQQLILHICSNFLWLLGAKLKDIWIAYGFVQSLAMGGLGEISMTACKGIWKLDCTLSSLSKRRNSFSYKYLDFINRQLLINFIIYFEKVTDLMFLVLEINESQNE